MCRARLVKKDLFSTTCRQGLTYEGAEMMWRVFVLVGREPQMPMSLRAPDCNTAWKARLAGFC